MKNLAIRPRWMGLMYRPVHLKTLALKNVETLVIFSLIILNFHKNIKKVRDIDKICNNAKFRKIKTKTTESQDFSMLKFLDGQALYVK